MCSLKPIRSAVPCLVLIVAVLGCGKGPVNLSEPVLVNGKVQWRGQPLNDTAISLQPLEQGHMALLRTDSTGKFNAEVIPGKYAYFIDAANNSNRGKVAGIPSKYQQADLGRTVVVQPGEELQLTFE